MNRSHSFASTACNYNFAHFGLAFAMDPSLKDLSSYIRVTRWLIKQKARSHPESQQAAIRDSYRL